MGQIGGACFLSHTPLIKPHVSVNYLRWAWGPPSPYWFRPCNRAKIGLIDALTVESAVCDRPMYSDDAQVVFECGFIASTADGKFYICGANQRYYHFFNNE